MRKRNSADNETFSKDKIHEKQLNTQYVFSKDDVELFLEVEVEGFYAAISRENENYTDQSGVIEVTIIRPETAEPSLNLVHNPKILNTTKGKAQVLSELQYRVKPHRRLVAKATDRCRIPQFANRRTKSFFPENVGDIVGDLPSKMIPKPRVIVPDIELKVCHGDHCDPLTSGPDVSCAENDKRNIAVELLKSYVNSCNSESNKVSEDSPCKNPLVYQFHMEQKSIEENYPLVEFSAVKKILESYAPDESSRCSTSAHQVIETMRKTLRVWGSDEKRIADTLRRDTSSLVRCEHCGVISLKEAQIPVPTMKDQLSLEVDKAELLHCDDENKCLSRTGRNKDSCYLGENNPRSKGSMSLIENEEVEDGVEGRKPGFEIRPENSAEVKFHSQLYCEEGIKSSSTDTMVAERESNSISKDIIKAINVGQKKESKSTLPLIMANEFGRCLGVEKNEKSNESRSKNTYSPRYSSRQITTKTVKKPVWNTCRDIRYRNNPETGFIPRIITQNKNAAPSSKDCEAAKALGYKNDKTDDNKADDMGARTEAAVSGNGSLRKKTSSQRNKPSSTSDIPTRLVKKISAVKPTSPKNVDNFLVREKPNEIEQQSFSLPKNNETELQPKTDLRLWRNRRLLAAGIQVNSEDQCEELNDVERSLHCECTAPKNDESSIDQRYSGNNDRRSFRSTNLKNCERKDINPDINYSVPLIPFPRDTFMNEDFIIDCSLADNSQPVQYNGESETTAFSSSSSENTNSLIQVPESDCNSLTANNNDKYFSDTIRSMKAHVDKAIKESPNYNAGVSNVKLYSNETLAKAVDISLEIDQRNVSADVDHIAKQYERLKYTNCHDSLLNETVSSSNAILLRSEHGQRMRKFEEILRVQKGDQSDKNHHRVGKGQNTVNPVEDTADKIWRRHSEIAESDKNFKTSDEIFRSQQKYLAMQIAEDKLSKKRLRMTYKNPTAVMSSSSGYSNEYNQEHDDRQRSLYSRKGESILQFNESEMFEHEITYDAISSKDISTESEENLEPEVLPMYRRIVESKDEMDWQTFQQLVGTLHPSQRELWSDICKAVSNEAKRVAGETGASTEVCIEINPVPTSQAFACENLSSTVKTSDNEISFETNMTLTDSETFSEQKSRGYSETIRESEKCH